MDSLINSLVDALAPLVNALMDFFLSGKGLVLLDAFAVLLLFVSLHGQAKVLFSPLGRINRQTFWEGFVAWFLINFLTIVLGVAHVAFGLSDQLALGFGDTDHVWYHLIILVVTIAYGLTSGWILAALCAKRWHDLNFSGWFAAINALPLLVIGYAWCVFLNSVGPTMYRLFVIKSTTAELSQVVGSSTPTNLDGWAYWSLILSSGLLIALAAYLGFAKGDTGGNAYGKSAV